MAPRGDEPPGLLVKWYDVTKWLLERVDGFPMNQRFIQNETQDHSPGKTQEHENSGARSAAPHTPVFSPHRVLVCSPPFILSVQSLPFDHPTTLFQPCGCGIFLNVMSEPSEASGLGDRS